MIKNFSIVLFLFFNLALFSQSTEFEFDFQQSIGNLEETDLLNTSFGRYDGFEIPLYEGEKVNFLLYTEDFNPVLILVSPKGVTYQESVGKKYDFAKITTLIPESGDWILYVASKNGGLGQYFLQNAIGPETAFTLRKEASDCDKVNFILAHARAAFQLLGDEGSGVKFKEECRRFLDREDGSYHSVIFEGNDLDKAEAVFVKWSEKILNCLPQGWQNKSINWKDSGNFNMKERLFYGKDSLNNNLNVIIRFSKLVKKELDPTRLASVEIIYKIVQ